MQDVSYPSRGNSAGGSTTSASIQQPRQQLSLPSSPAAPPSIDPLLPAPPTAVTPSITTSPVRPAPVLSSVPYRTGPVSGAKPVHTYEKMHGFGGIALTALQADIWPGGYCVSWPKEERVSPAQGSPSRQIDAPREKTRERSSIRKAQRHAVSLSS